jgi:bifunctional DNA-binding transcriptional regulator/antitoxin component of YhaV-PrlF toxin-antitoxin module
MEARTIQLRGRGSLTLPATFRERHGLHEGDVLTLVDLGGVFVLSPKVGVVGKLAREIEALRRESGLSLDDLLTAVREERARYGSERDDPLDDDEG